MKGQKKLVMSLIAACLFALGGIFLCSCAPQAQLPTFSVNENGELVALYPGGSSENLGKVTGSDGEKGEKGEKGEDGADGQGGISSATVNDSLKNAVSIQLIVEYSHRTGSFGPTTTNKMVFYGSGVIISLDKEQGDAYILTNAHVIYDGAFVQNGTTYTPTSTPPTRNLYLYGMGYETYQDQYAIPFTVVGYSKENDLAVLKVENSQILKNSVAQAAPIGNSDNLLVGEQTYLVGNALGDGIAATTGVVSVERERIDVLFADGTTVLTLDSIRTDAAANHGNSGGGMYNQKGELVGILFAGYNENGAQGMGNCLPINTVMGIANSIINNCNGATVNTKKADLGITLNLQSVTQVYDERTGKVFVQERNVVQSVAQNSAAQGILRFGDELVSASLHGENTQIYRQWQLFDLLWRVRAGDTLVVTVLRNGEQISVLIPFTAEHFVSVP